METLFSSPQAQVAKRQSAPAPTLETQITQGLPTLLPGLEPGVSPSRTQGGTLCQTQERDLHGWLCLSQSPMRLLRHHRGSSTCPHRQRQTGYRDNIQHFRCQWCRRDFSCRRHRATLVRRYDSQNAALPLFSWIDRNPWQPLFQGHFRFQDLEYRAVWLRSGHLAGVPLAC